MNFKKYLIKKMTKKKPKSTNLTHKTRDLDYKTMTTPQKSNKKIIMNLNSQSIQC